MYNLRRSRVTSRSHLLRGVQPRLVHSKLLKRTMRPLSEQYSATFYSVRNQLRLTPNATTVSMAGKAGKPALRFTGPRDDIEPQRNLSASCRGRTLARTRGAKTATEASFANMVKRRDWTRSADLLGKLRC